MQVKIDAIDSKILYELDKDCRVSDNVLAKKVKRSRESVRNRINRLIEEGVITDFITSINPSRFGYMFFKLYFQIANIPKEKERFYAYIKSQPGLYWFGSNDGVWDFHCAFYAKGVTDFCILKDKIFGEFKDLIVKRDVGMLVHVKQYPKKYLTNTSERPEPTIFAGETIETQLDDVEKRIINELVRNARVPIVQLAQKVGSTVDIVRSRMRKMEDNGVILQYRIAVNHAKIGFTMFKAFTYFNSISQQDEKRLLEYAKQHNSIVYIIKQLASWDFELEIMAHSYEEFIEIMNDIRQKFVGVLRNYEFALMREDIWAFGDKDIFEMKQIKTS